MWILVMNVLLPVVLVKLVHMLKKRYDRGIMMMMGGNDGGYDEDNEQTVLSDQVDV